MRLVKQRLNPATNSSSSHSIVRVKEGFGIQDYTEVLAESDYYDRHDFTLISLEEKLRYVATIFKEQEDVSALPTPLEGVDHQSMHIFGYMTLEQAVAYVSDPSVIILGGTDEDDGHPLTMFGLVDVLNHCSYNPPQVVTA